MTSLAPVLGPILGPILRSPLEAGVGRYDPVRLFANGELGALLWTTLSPMFQDSAGTTPAGDSDPVGYFGDLSPNGNHALQSTDAERPPLATDGAGLYLNPDGTNHWLNFGSSIIGASGARTLAFTGFFAASPTGTKGCIGVTTSGGYVGRYQGEHAFVVDNDHLYKSGLDALTEDTVVVRLNGTNIRITTSAGTVEVADTSVAGTISRLLCSSGTAGRMAGKARGFLIINRAISDAEVVAYRAWAASQAGLLRLSDPYAAVDWSGEQVAGLTHAHGTTLASLTDMTNNDYAALGFSNYYPSDPSLAYPLTNMTDVTSVSDDVIGLPNAEYADFTDTSGHVSAPGSLFACGTANPDGTGYEGAFRDFIADWKAELLYENAGGICFNHPKLSFAGVPAVKALLDYSPYVLGIEIYNHLAEWNYDGKGWALDTWHDILVSGRRCYGFGAPDHADVEGAPATRQGYNRLLLPSAYATMSRAEREQACLEAYYNGHWYVSVAESSPVLTGMTVSGNTITVTFAEPCDITFAWANPGDATYTTTDAVTGTTASYEIQGTEAYVRAIGTGAGTDETSLTQAVMFNARPIPL